MIRKVALLMIFVFGLAMTTLVAQQPSSQQNAPARDQAQQPTQPPPRVDVEPSPADRKLEQAIQGELQKDPHMTYSRVRVHVTDQEVVLVGVVLTATAKDQAEQIATQQAGGRKVTNKIRVNPQVHHGPGL